MPKLLCKTVESFAIQGRGTIVVLEDAKEWRIPAEELVKVRESVRILRSDGSSVQTFIKGLDFVLKSDRSERVSIELPKDVGLDDVPAGSFVFLEREDADPILWDGEPASFEGSRQGLELSWQRTRHRLDLARQAIDDEARSSEVIRCVEAFGEYLSHNELECALDELVKACEFFTPSPKTWELLAFSAESMGLDQRTVGLRECAVSAISESNSSK